MVLVLVVVVLWQVIIPHSRDRNFLIESIVVDTGEGVVK